MASDTNPAAVLYLNRNFEWPKGKPTGEKSKMIPWTSYTADYIKVFLSADKAREEVITILAKLKESGTKVPKAYKGFFDEYFKNQRVEYREDDEDFNPDVFAAVKGNSDFIRAAVPVLTSSTGDKKEAEKKLISDGILPAEKAGEFFVHVKGEEEKPVKKPMTEEEEKKQTRIKQAQIEQEQAARAAETKRMQETMSEFKAEVKQDVEAVKAAEKKKQEDDMISVDSFISVLEGYNIKNIDDKTPVIKDQLIKLPDMRDYLNRLLNGKGSQESIIEDLNKKLGLNLTLEELEPIQPPVLNPQVDFAIDEYDTVQTTITKDDKTPLQLPGPDPLISPQAPPSVVVSEEPTLQASQGSQTQQPTEETQQQPGQIDPLTEVIEPSGGPSGPTGPDGPAPTPVSAPASKPLAKGGQFATGEIPFEHPPKYHKYSIKIYLGSDTRPNYDPELEKNVYSSDLSKEEIIQGINSVIARYGADLFIFGTRKSDTIDELHELTQLQFCIKRNLATGPRFASANIPISQLVSIYNKMAPQQTVQQLTPEEAQAQSGDITSAEEMAQQTQQTQQGAPAQAPQSTGSVQVQISPNQALENVINDYREADFTSQGKPRFNESLVASTLAPRPRNIKGPGSMIDPVNSFIPNVPMKVKTTRKSVRII